MLNTVRMSLETLPEEILEEIFQHLTAEDLASVVAVGWQGAESFWRRVCDREGSQRTAEDDTWRGVFQRHINWRTGSYAKLEYRCKLPLVDDERKTYKKSLQGRNLIVTNNEGIWIYNIAKEPVCLLSLASVLLAVSNSRLLLRDSTGMVSVYTKERDGYRQLLTLDLPRGVRQSFALTDHYLAVLEGLTITIADLQTRVAESVALICGTMKTQPMFLSISGPILNVLMLDATEYKLRRYHLQRREWLDEILVFGGAVMIGVPQLRTNERFIVCWSHCLEGNYAIPARVWSEAGELLNARLKSGSFEDEQILWLVLEGDHVIMSTRETSLVIVSLMTNRCREMLILEGFLDCKVVSNSLLVLSGSSYAFRIIDFKKATFLYNVSYEESVASPKLSERTHFFANEFLLVTLKVYFNTENYNSTEGDIQTLSLQRCVNENETNMGDPETHQRNALVRVYDFS